MGFASRNPYCAQDDRSKLGSQKIYVLLCDYAAGDAISGSAGGVGLVIVGFGVDNDGGAAVAEERMGVGAEGYIFVLEFGVGFAFGVDGKIFHVAGVVAFGIIESVLFGVGIEMRTGGFEIRGIALGILMEVNGVHAGGEIVKVQLEANT